MSKVKITKITCDICGEDITYKGQNIFRKKYRLFKGRYDSGRCLRYYMCSDCLLKFEEYVKKNNEVTEQC